LFATTNVPAFIKTEPVKVFDPPRANEPDPFFAKPTDPEKIEAIWGFIDAPTVIAGLSKLIVPPERTYALINVIPLTKKVSVSDMVSDPPDAKPNMIGLPLSQGRNTVPFHQLFDE
jgi:hypothetical protein